MTDEELAREHERVRSLIATTRRFAKRIVGGDAAVPPCDLSLLLSASGGAHDRQRSLAAQRAIEKIVRQVEDLYFLSAEECAVTAQGRRAIRLCRHAALAALKLQCVGNDASAASDRQEVIRKVDDALARFEAGRLLKFRRWAVKQLFLLGARQGVSRWEADEVIPLIRDDRSFCDPHITSHEYELFGAAWRACRSHLAGKKRVNGQPVDVWNKINNFLNLYDLGCENGASLKTSIGGVPSLEDSDEDLDEDDI